VNKVEPIRDMNKVLDIQEYLKSTSQRDYVLFTLGITTARRIGDILKLKVKDVRNKESIKITESKTKKEIEIPINDDLKEFFKSYLKNKNDYEYLIKSQKNENSAISRQQAYKILKDVAERFGLSSIGTHSMRKTFGYHFYNDTKDIMILKEILNHSHPEETLRYIGLRDSDKYKKMKKFKYTRK